MLHGGDYNPDQWLHMPQILADDIRLAKLSRCNAMTIGIFAWTAMEPEEGRYTFDWLDERMDAFAKNGMCAVLATPSGAKPAWMSQKYPEIMRVDQNGIRNRHGGRHNHCLSSPVYREKVAAINTKLAQRYKDHPALLVWHLSNEYGGECCCDRCEQAFRAWVQRKFKGNLDALNKAWNTSFWSHTFTDWSQIEAPTGRGESLVHGHNLDWKRFVTSQHVDFMVEEIKPLKAFAPAVPVTTNMMGTYPGIDYWKMAQHLDVISWDNYPQWGCGNDLESASYVAMINSLNRSLKAGKPFMMMESTPSVTNWQPHGRLKRPGMHLLSSLQAVAHGSDTVQYFQWRKSRGSCEKFHGAVVDHCGHEHTRVFKDVTDVGEALAKLDDVVGSHVPARAGIIYDWENRWIIDDAKGPRSDGHTRYESTVHHHYMPFWQMGIAADIVNMDCDFAGYDLLVAPMLYMLRPGVAERIEAFVKKGGTFVTTYLSGIADENDLVFLGGWPGPLRKLLGIWAEEIDALKPDEANHIVMKAGNELGLKGQYEARIFCDLIHDEGCEVLATYRSDFYAGRPALTVNKVGKGRAYYMAARCEDKFLADFYGMLAQRLKLPRAFDAHLPKGVTASVRTDGANRFVFVMNFTPRKQSIDLAGVAFVDLIESGKVEGKLALEGYGVRVLRQVRGATAKGQTSRAKVARKPRRK
jgi:beta-galactosidase